MVPRIVVEVNVLTNDLLAQHKAVSPRTDSPNQPSQDRQETRGTEVMGRVLHERSSQIPSLLSFKEVSRSTAIIVRGRFSFPDKPHRYEGVD